MLLGNRTKLKDLCNKLVSFELTIDEVMETDENDKVDSTTSHAATLDAANKELPGPSKKRKVESKKAKQAAQIDAAKSRAAEIFSSATTPLQQSDLEKSLQKQLREQKEQIEKLKKQLQVQAVPSIPTVTNNLCNFKSSSQTNIYNELQSPAPIDCSPSPLPSELSSTPEPNYDISIDPFESSYTSPHNTTYGVTVTPPLISKAPNPKRLLKVAKNEGAAAGRVKAAVSPSLVELVPGYGVRLTQRQLDEAISESGGAPTKLIRKLVSVFFSREELAESSCYGLRNNNALDKDILAACIKFVQDRYDVSKAVLVDAVNDKCSGCRRKK